MYTYKQDNDEVVIIDPIGKRLASVKSHAEAKTLVVHLNTPVVSTHNGEYTVSEAGFSFMTEKSKKVTLNKNYFVPVIADPNGIFIAHIKNFIEGIAVVEHLSRTS